MGEGMVAIIFISPSTQHLQLQLNSYKVAWPIVHQIRKPSCTSILNTQVIKEKGLLYCTHSWVEVNGLYNMHMTYLWVVVVVL